IKDCLDLRSAEGSVVERKFVDRAVERPDAGGGQVIPDRHVVAARQAVVDVQYFRRSVAHLLAIDVKADRAAVIRAGHVVPLAVPDAGTGAWGQANLVLGTVDVEEQPAGRARVKTV